MDEYIERGPLIEICEGQGHADIDDILSVEVADVAPVVHGKWLPACLTVNGEYTQVGWSCSVCGRVVGREQPYCNCGAKMEEAGRSIYPKKAEGNMGEYIKRQDALNNVQWAIENHSPVDEAIELTISADVAPVVLCRKCKHNDEKKQICALTGVHFLEDDFCSRGERR